MSRNSFSFPHSASLIHTGAFALVELLVVLAVLASGVAFVMPGLAGWLTRERVESRAQALLRSFAYAKAEVVRRGAALKVCRSDAGGHCSNAPQHCGGRVVPANDWACGWAIVVAGNGAIDSGTILRIEPALAAVAVRVKSSDSYFSFRPPAGRLKANFGHIEIAARDIASRADSARLHRCLRISSGSRVRVNAGSCAA